MTIPIPGASPLVFDMPWWLLLAGFAPLAAWGLLRAASRDRARRLAVYADVPLLARLGASVVLSGHRGALLCALVLAGLALGGPRWGLASAASTAEGIDLVIAIDASLSMLATDERPSRLERVKQEVRRLRAMHPGDRVALVAFAGRSYLLTPLTTDDGAIDLLLETLDPSTVGQAGSAIGQAIEQGTTLLLGSDGLADRALVLFSDGESFDDPEAVRAAAQQAGARGITLVTVGMGTSEGSTIPVRETNGRLSVKRDDTGAVVTTRYVPSVLSAAATAARGAFIPAEAADKASRIRGTLRQLRAARREADERQALVLRMAWLLWPALLLLAWDSWRSTGGAVPRTRVVARSSVSVPPVVLLALLLMPMAMGACREPPDPAVLLDEGKRVEAIRAFRQVVASGDSSERARYNLGAALLAADSVEAAQSILEPVRRLATGEVQARARFNAGLAALRLARALEAGASREAALPRRGDAAQQRLAAREAFRAFLRDRPGHRDAQWNYELSLKRPASAPESPGGGGSSPQSSPSTGGLDPRQAEALLGSAAREERDVQRRRRRPATAPPRGRDW